MTQKFPCILFRVILDEIFNTSKGIFGNGRLISSISFKFNEKTSKDFNPI